MADHGSKHSSGWSPTHLSSIKFTVMVVAFELAMIILYGIFADYADAAQATSEEGSNNGKLDNYPFYQDVHIMIFIGFGFLMTFLHTYSWSAVGLNFLLSALAIQWGILCVSFFHKADKGSWHETVKLDVNTLINGDFAAGALMITFGAVIGKVSSTQLVGITFFEMIFYAINEMIIVKRFEAIDMGGSMVIHAFGAYFGLGLSYVIGNPARGKASPSMSKWSSTGAMIGTIFLWCFWPSFNGALATNDQQHRVIINTVMSIASSCIITWALSRIFRSSHKFDFEDIANATLAGGVAVGSSADLVIKPWGAMLLGSVAGLISTFGFVFLGPFLDKVIGLHDTCGVHNLHGMPGILGGIAGAISAATAGESSYGKAIGHIFHARAPSNATLAAEMGLEPGLDRSASGQGGYQGAGIVLSVFFGIVAGAITGFIVRTSFFEPLKDHFYDDHAEFHVSVEDEYAHHEEEKPLKAEPSGPLIELQTRVRLPAAGSADGSLQLSNQDFRTLLNSVLSSLERQNPGTPPTIQVQNEKTGTVVSAATGGASGADIHLKLSNN